MRKLIFIFMMIPSFSFASSISKSEAIRLCAHYYVSTTYKILDSLNGSSLYDEIKRWKTTKLGEEWKNGKISFKKYSKEVNKDRLIDADVIQFLAWKINNCSNSKNMVENLSHERNL